MIKLIYFIILIFLFGAYRENFNYNLHSNEEYNTVYFLLIYSGYYIWSLRRSVDILGLEFYETLVTIPMLALYALGGTSWGLAMFSVLSSITIYYSAVLASRRQIKLFRVMPYLGDKYVLLLVCVYIFYLIWKLGLNLNPNLILLESVYDRRFQVENNYNIFLTYTSSFISKFLMPIGLLRALQNRKILYIIMYLGLFLIYYLTTSLKTVLFTPVLIIVLFYMSNIKWIKLSSFIELGLVVVCLLELFLLDISLVGRRLLYIPSLLNNYYYDFFDSNYQYLSYGWYNPFVDYSYSLSPSRLISSLYWSDSTTSANNGLLSSGFMNFGYLGILIYSMIFGVILAQGGFKTQNRYGGVYFLLVFVFTTSFFVTSLLSHGVLMFLLIRRAIIKDA